MSFISLNVLTSTSPGLGTGLHMSTMGFYSSSSHYRYIGGESFLSYLSWFLLPSVYNHFSWLFSLTNINSLVIITFGCTVGLKPLFAVLYSKGRVELFANLNFWCALMHRISLYFVFKWLVRAIFYDLCYPIFSDLLAFFCSLDWL